MAGVAREGNNNGEGLPQAVADNPVVVRANRPRTNAIRRMGDYAAYFEDNTTTDAPEVSQIPGLEEAVMFGGDEDGSGNSHYLAFQLNLEAGQAEEATSEESRSIYFLGCLSSLILELTRDFVNDMKDSGITVTVDRVPSSMEGRFVTMPAVRMSPRKSMAIFGYLILTLFKAINASGFRSWSEKRLRALYAIAGYYRLPDSESLEVFGSITQAQCYRTLIGGHTGLRIRVLNSVLALKNKPTPIGSICNYVAGILSWTDMTAFNFIYEAILVPKSPILQSPELASEILNLKRAAMKILAFSQPQYFRILAPPADAVLMEKSNFPKLLALAKAIKMETETASSQFVSNTLTGPLANLLAEHKAYMAEMGDGTTLRNVVFKLTAMDDVD